MQLFFQEIKIKTEVNQILDFGYSQIINALCLLNVYNCECSKGNMTFDLIQIGIKVNLFTILLDFVYELNIYRNFI